MATKYPECATLRRADWYEIFAGLGWRYGALKRGPIERCVERAASRERMFLVDIANEMARERSGDSVLVYSDESYIHSSHCVLRGWFDPKSAAGNAIAAGGKGERLIVLHAFTRFGMMSSKDENKRFIDPPTAPLPLGETAQSCALVFTGADCEDYHDTMDSEVYMKWVHGQLIPTFKCLFPKKRCVFVIDNAGYHRKSADKPKYTKSARIDWLCDATQSQRISVFRSGKWIEFDARKANARAPNGASAEEVRIVTSAWRRFLPPILNSALSDAFDRWCESEKRTKSFDCHRVLYTPPGLSEAQPIENVWGIVKQQVASQYKQYRTANETRDQLLTAFNSMTSDLCLRTVEATEKRMNNRLVHHAPLLTGSLSNLVFDQQKLDALIVGYVKSYVEAGINDASSDEEDEAPEPEPVMAPLPPLALSLATFLPAAAPPKPA